MIHKFSSNVFVKENFLLIESNEEMKLLQLSVFLYTKLFVKENGIVV